MPTIARCAGGVFAEDNGGTVDEQSPVSPNPRTQKILDAEKATLEGKGVVLRLAGASSHMPSFGLCGLRLIEQGSER